DRGERVRAGAVQPLVVPAGPRVPPHVLDQPHAIRGGLRELGAVGAHLCRGGERRGLARARRSGGQGEDRDDESEGLPHYRFPNTGSASEVRSVPSVGESITISSPGPSQTRGCFTLPTPAGVPVETMSPGSSVISFDR